MTERKWTLGPWVAVRNSAFWEINPSREYGDDHIPYTVGDVCASDPGDTKGLQEANAHLIAAAPDLYEALDMFAQAVENDTICARPSDREILMTILEQGNTALAKARGET